jgi:hypothetical protein
MLESLGKSFLLVIDVLSGSILTNEKRHRIFNRAGNTIVIKMVHETKKIKDKSGAANITYRND